MLSYFQFFENEITYSRTKQSFADFYLELINSKGLAAIALEAHKNFAVINTLSKENEDSINLMQLPGEMKVFSGAYLFGWEDRGLHPLHQLKSVSVPEVVEILQDSWITGNYCNVVHNFIQSQNEKLTGITEQNLRDIGQDMLENLRVADIQKIKSALRIASTLNQEKDDGQNISQAYDDALSAFMRSTKKLLRLKVVQN